MGLSGVAGTSPVAAVTRFARFHPYGPRRTAGQEEGLVRRRTDGTTEGERQPPQKRDH